MSTSIFFLSDLVYRFTVACPRFSYKVEATVTVLLSFHLVNATTSFPYDAYAVLTDPRGSLFIAAVSVKMQVLASLFEQIVPMQLWPRFFSSNSKRIEVRWLSQ